MPLARTRSLRALAFVAFALLVDATALTVNLGCQACDGGICTSRARVIVGEPGDGPLLDGTYEIELTADGVSATSTCEVTDGGVEIDCGPLAGFEISAPLFDSAPGTAHTQIWFDFGEQLPKIVALRVAHEATVVLDSSTELDYQLTDPGCDDDCRDAILNLRLDR